MDRQTPLPRRFEAHSKPGDGEVVITDTETGRAGTVRMGAYQAVCSLMMDLYGDDDDRQHRDELKTTVPAGTDVIDVDTSPSEPFDYNERPAVETSAPAPEPEPEPAPAAPPQEEAPKPAPKKARKQPAKEEASKPASQTQDKQASKGKKADTASGDETKTKKLGRPRRTPEPASVPNEGEDFIEDDEFNLRRDPDTPTLSYVIEKKDGTEFGKVTYESEKKIRVSPLAGQDFEESTHVSLVGASVRIEMLIED